MTVCVTGCVLVKRLRSGISTKAAERLARRMAFSTLEFQNGQVATSHTDTQKHTETHAHTCTHEHACTRI